MLSDQERNAYLSKLGFSEAPEPTKENLDRLIYAHQTNIPFSTVELHKSQTTPDLSLGSIYNKVIVQGKGGYCFELNKLFQALLESLGYKTRPVLCRAVRGRESKMPINHRGMIVAIDELEFSVDVGFGGPMPAGALELTPSIEQDICGETFIAEKDGSWWKIERITKAKADLYDDEVPTRRQTELELCSATVDDIDFGPLNVFCSQPGTLFRDHDVINLRTTNGYKGYKDGILTIRENGKKTVIELGKEDRNAALLKHFNIPG